MIDTVLSDRCSPGPLFISFSEVYAYNDIRRGMVLKMDIFFVVDTHCDTLGYAYAGKSKLINEYNVSKKYPHLQVYAMYCAEEGESDIQSYERACRYVELYRRGTAEEGIVCCKTYRDIENALDTDTKYMSMLSIEGCECLNGSLENLHRFYEDGVRMIAPVWNHNNLWAAGSLSTGTASDTGLTDKGVELVELCEKLGIIIDVSHSSDNTLKDIFSITKRSLCASHSNFREVCNHNRNLTREQAVEISRRGGYIGLNLYYKFVRNNIDLQGESYITGDLISHIEYAKRLGICEHIGFGFDIDGVGGAYPRDINLKESIHDKFIENIFLEEKGCREMNFVSGSNFLKFLARYGR